MSQTAQPAEKVVAIVPNTTLKSGFMGIGSRQYTLAITGTRIVFARMTSAMMKEIASQARADAKARGEGFLGQVGAQLTSYSAFAKRYLETPPEQILAETDGNFAIDRASITKVAFKTGHVFGDDSNANTTDRLVIKTTQKKYDLTLAQGSSEAKRAFAQAGISD